MAEELKPYRSPFRMPDEVKCTSKWDHDHYSALHAIAGNPGNAWGYKKQCPVHNRLSPDCPTWEWRTWAECREQFVSYDGEDPWMRNYYMELMLRQVSETCPPDALPPKQHILKPGVYWNWPAIGITTLAVAVIVLCFLAAFL